MKLYRTWCSRIPLNGPFPLISTNITSRSRKVHRGIPVEQDTCWSVDNRIVDKLRILFYHYDSWLSVIQSIALTSRHKDECSKTYERSYSFATTERANDKKIGPSLVSLRLFFENDRVCPVQSPAGREISAPVVVGNQSSGDGKFRGAVAATMDRQSRDAGNARCSAARHGSAIPAAQYGGASAPPTGAKNHRQQ